MECGECTLCCFMLAIKELGKPVNTDCIHCDHGCKIHGNHPKECSEFNCMYIQVTDIDIGLRSDKCKVIFEKMTDDLIIGTLDARHKMTKEAKAQIQAFLDQGYTVKLGASDFRKPITWQPTIQTY
jgi:hypothetical protein